MPAVILDEVAKSELRAMRLKELELRDIWNFDDFALYTNLPRSSLNLIIAETPAPFFMAGRRRHIYADDAKQWMKQLRKNNPYQPRVNNPREKVAA
jgi:hypothetical protein